MELLSIKKSNVKFIIFISAPAFVLSGRNSDAGKVVCGGSYRKKWEAEGLRRKFFWLLLLVLLIFSGCDNTQGPGYEIVYQSGYTRNCYTRVEPIPIENSGYHLQNNKEERRIQILDGEAVIYELDCADFYAMRGEAGNDGLIWISSERWGAPHYNGYIDHTLIQSRLVQINPSDGEILIQKEIGRDELFLTSKGSKCYFYDRGEEGEKNLFGVEKRKTRNAEIFYRDVSNWKEKVNVYDFSYIGKPVGADGIEVKDKSSKLIFHLKSESILISFIKKERSDDEVEQWSIEIPLE